MKSQAYTGREFLYSSIYMIDTNMNMHFRRVFNLFDLIGSLGGVLDIIVYMFAILFTVSDQSFILDAISKWYLSRTKCQKLF